MRWGRIHFQLLVLLKKTFLVQFLSLNYFHCLSGGFNFVNFMSLFNSVHSEDKVFILPSCTAFVYKSRTSIAQHSDLGFQVLSILQQFTGAFADISMATALNLSTEQDAPLEPNRPKRKSGRNSRVHFDEGDSIVMPLEEGQPILVEDIFEDVERKTIGVYLGFLQEAHKYEVRFKIPLGSLVGFVHSREQSVVLSAEPKHGQMKAMNVLPDPANLLEIFMELRITEPISFDDKFTISSDIQSPRFVNIKLCAQVLGKGMGTPSLKEGIRCIGAIVEKSFEEPMSSTPAPNPL